MDINGLLAATFNRFCILDAYAFLRRKLTKSQVFILMYHRISPMRDSSSLEPLSPQSFEHHIRYFCENYEILPLDRLVKYIEKGKTLPEKAVVITFDDGYKDNYLYAYPILKKYHVPATIFLTTGHIGTSNLFWFDKVSYIIQNTNIDQLNLDELGSYSLQSELDRFQVCSIISERLKKMSEERRKLLVEKLLTISGVKIPQDLAKGLILSWDEIREMSNDGISFGAHTVSHPILTNLPLAQANLEIIQSKMAIEEEIGKQVDAFSYPNGGFDDFNAEIVELIKKNGFTCAVAVSPNKLIGSKDSVYELSRIPMGEDFNKCKIIFCGLWGDLHDMARLGGLE